MLPRRALLSAIWGALVEADAKGMAAFYMERLGFARWNLLSGFSVHKGFSNIH